MEIKTDENGKLDLILNILTQTNANLTLTNANLAKLQDDFNAHVGACNATGYV